MDEPLGALGEKKLTLSSLRDSTSPCSTAAHSNKSRRTSGRVGALNKNCSPTLRVVTA